MGAAQSNEDLMDLWSRSPRFDFLEPRPFDQVAPLLIYATVAALTGLFLAFLTDSGFILLRRPAKLFWSLALLILVYAGALGLSRVTKFVLGFIFVSMVVPGSIVVGSIYVYTRGSNGGQVHEGEVEVDQAGKQDKQADEVDRGEVPAVGEIKL